MSPLNPHSLCQQNMSGLLQVYVQLTGNRQLQFKSTKGAFGTGQISNLCRHIIFLPFFFVKWKFM